MTSGTDLQLQAAEETIAKLREENIQLWALFRLIANDCVFVNFADYGFCKPGDDNETLRSELPLGFNILCSDTFEWACADAESIKIQDAPALLEIGRRGGWDALAKWVQAKRGGPGSSPFIEPVRAAISERDQLRTERDDAMEELSACAKLLRDHGLVGFDDASLRGVLHYVLQQWVGRLAERDAALAELGRIRKMVGDAAARCVCRLGPSDEIISECQLHRDLRAERDALRRALIKAQSGLSDIERGWSRGYNNLLVISQRDVDAAIMALNVVNAALAPASGEEQS